MKNKEERDWLITLLLVVSSIITLGVINLLMYIIDGITPKDFFSLESNSLLTKR